MQQWIGNRRWLSSSLLFAFQMVASAIVGLIALFVVLAIIVRLDVAFFEANGMAQSLELREAFYYQVFQFDNPLVFMLLAGFAAVAGLSFLFCRSQFNSFRNLAAAMRLLSDRWEAPPMALLGRFNPYATYFFDIVTRRINGETEGGIEPLLDRAGKEWPVNPRVAWSDQFQFAAMSGMLGLFFSACCAMVYLKVSGRVVEVANSIVHFSSITGPTFLKEQFGIVDTLVWLILALTTLNFIMIGYRFGKEIAEADYALLRDLKDFMDGNFRKRLFLRAGDPAAEYVPLMNESLDKIEQKIKNPSHA